MASRIGLTFVENLWRNRRICLGGQLARIELTDCPAGRSFPLRGRVSTSIPGIAALTLRELSGVIRVRGLSLNVVLRRARAIP